MSNVAGNDVERDDAKAQARNAIQVRGKVSHGAVTLAAGVQANDHKRRHGNNGAQHGEHRRSITDFFVGLLRASKLYWLFNIGKFNLFRRSQLGSK